MADKALLVGINNYKSISDLRGCVNDVEDMEKLLREVFSFASGNIRTLTDNKATKREVFKQMRWLLKDAREGDRLVFHFSGHGSYTADADEDDEKGYDELLCLYDMDWNNADSYLLDDEIRKWTEDLADGASLLIVLDNCHSGTGTRVMLDRPSGDRRSVTAPEKLTVEVDMEATMARALEAPAEGERSLGARTAEAVRRPEQTVLARFFPPPPDVQARIDARARRSVGRREAVAVSSLNHVLLAGCRDDQTAADAWLDNRANGAFTHHLCKVLRSGGADLDRGELIDQLARGLRAGHFNQIPQLEAARLHGPLFGRGADQPQPGRPAASPGTVGVSQDVGRQILEKLDRILGLLAARPGAAPVRQARGQRYLVCVHGIGQQPAGYSDRWWGALQPHLGGLLGSGTLGDTRREVVWSDLVNARSLGRVAASQEADFLRRAILDTLEDRSAHYADHSQTPPGGSRSAINRAVDRGSGVAIDDFMRYLLSSQVRGDVLARFYEVVRPLLAAGNEIDVISHSWGTVVAYEGLLALDAEGLSGSVRNLFTAGAALSISAVRWKLNLGSTKPGLVRRWTNLDAKGDSVGGPLGGHFDVDREYLELEPTNCSRGWFGYSLLCAHSSYFDRDNETVNRDVFAQWMLAD